MSASLTWAGPVGAPMLLPQLHAGFEPNILERGLDGLYRDCTVLLLKRYCRMSIDMGRMPSILGREFFRAKVSSYKVSTFEDAVIFVHDMERCINRLSQEEQKLIAGVIFLEYTQREAAQMLGITRPTLVRRYNEMLDRLASILLRCGLIDSAELKRARRRTPRELSGDQPSAPKKPCSRELLDHPLTGRYH